MEEREQRVERCAVEAALRAWAREGLEAQESGERLAAPGWEVC